MISANKTGKEYLKWGNGGGDTARIRRIPGSGYGLWEARFIVEAHGGEVHVKLHPTDIHKHEGRASRVVFSIEIPLKHKKVTQEVEYVKQTKKNPSVR